MEAPDYTIESDVGDSLDGLSFQWLQADGTPKDLTAFSTATLIVWDSSGTAVVTLALATGLTIPTPTNGTVIVNATVAQLSAASAGTYTYRVTVTDGTTSRSLAKGVFIRHPTIPTPPDS